MGGHVNVVFVAKQLDSGQDVIGNKRLGSDVSCMSRCLPFNKNVPTNFFPVASWKRVSGLMSCQDMISQLLHGGVSLGVPLQAHAQRASTLAGQSGLLLMQRVMLPVLHHNASPSALSWNICPMQNVTDLEKEEVSSCLFCLLFWLSPRFPVVAFMSSES